MIKKKKYPCWLTPIQLEQADALLNLGFHYCGNADGFIEGYLVCKIHGWTFRSVCGEIALDAELNGALYSWCLEILPNSDINGFFEARVEEAKTAIRDVVKSQKTYANIGAKQLSLFT